MDPHAWTWVIWLGDHWVTPVLQWLGRHDDPYDITVALLLTTLQLFLIGGVFRPLESLWPAERWSDRRLTRIDRTYTLLMLLGLFPLFSYLILVPLTSMGGSTEAASTVHGLRAWVPWFQQHPLALFAVYYLLYDLLYYWMHRAQHAIPWWWALHSLHHSQRQLSCWSNDRGSYLDGMLQSFILASVGLLAGVEADEFAALMLLGELVQNYSHTNIRFGFGRLGRRVLVDPLFHRLHHMVVDPQRPSLHNCNFGQVFSFWDILFRTSLYDEPIRPTGVADPVVDADNERGLVAMQWHALRRFWGCVRRPVGWRFGEVAFSEDCEPIPVQHVEESPTEPAEVGTTRQAPATSLVSPGDGQ